MLEQLGATVEIAPGRTGAFEVTRDGDLLFSKLGTARFPDDDEVRALANVA
ncbi:MAG: Rdx family protein [Proteobacteria bacterium]|nr:Rdx family protein [Pseudomonadota bacterium]